MITAKMFKAAVLALGGLSAPSKMPCFSWSTPAIMCQIGAKLARVKGSVCSGCYATKGFYQFKNAKNAMDRRWVILSAALIDTDKGKEFIDNFVTALTYLRTRERGKTYSHFRWHDSGDIQSQDHAEMIAEIARQTPGIKHWVPTREYAYVKNVDTPGNLVFRLSATMIDAPMSFGPNLPTSSVHKNSIVLGSYVCPAPKQNGECKDCRACWDKDIKNVSYSYH